MKMTMRYAHLSPAFLSAEVSLLDPPKPPSPSAKKGKATRATASRDQKCQNLFEKLARRTGRFPQLAHP
jgi:hypothetical protein